MKFNSVSAILLLFLCGSALFAQIGGNTIGAATFCSPSGGGVIGVTSYSGTIVNWQFTANGGQSWTSTGNTLPQQTYNGLTETTCYRAIIQDGMNIPDTSTITCITVYQQSNGGVIAGGGIYCVGNGTLTLSGNVGAIQNWEYSVNNASTWTMVANTSNQFEYTSVSENRLYRALVQNTSNCNAVYSNTVSVIISPAVGGNLPNVSYCDVSGAGVLRLENKVGNVSGWQSSKDFGVSWTDISNTTDSVIYSNLGNTISYRAIVNLPGCNIDTSSIGTIAINRTSSGKIVNNDTTVEYNDNQGELVLKENKGNVVEWQYALGDITNWNTLLNTSPSYTYTNLTDTTYFRVIVQYESCLPDTSNRVAVNVLPKRIAVVTNYFSPNADGYNDTWFVKGISNFENNEVFVYNSLGNEVFNTKKYQNDWTGTYNGKPLPDGTYYYVIKLYNPDEIFKGSLTIMRGK